MLWRCRVQCMLINLKFLDFYLDRRPRIITAFTILRYGVIESMESKKKQQTRVITPS